LAIAAAKTQASTSVSGSLAGRLVGWLGDMPVLLGMTGGSIWPIRTSPHARRSGSIAP
jgi:hypothetical protein